MPPTHSSRTPPAAAPAHIFFLILSLALALAAPAFAANPKALETISERSGFRTTGRYDEVERLCAEFVKAYPQAVRSFEFGRTPEGRPMLGLVVSTSGA